MSSQTSKTSYGLTQSSANCFTYLPQKTLCKIVADDIIIFVSHEMLSLAKSYFPDDILNFLKLFFWEQEMSLSSAYQILPFSETKT